MALQKHPLDALEFFLPNKKSFEICLALLANQPIKLFIKKERKSIFGNYSFEKKFNTITHQITINGTLPPFHFLITLIHELSHYFTNLKYGSDVKAHGEEWKIIFSNHLNLLLKEGIFPAQIADKLANYALNPKASSCHDFDLYSTLYYFENTDKEWELLGQLDLKFGDIFINKNGKKYAFIEKQKKNIKVKNLSNTHYYLAPPTLEVKFIDS